MCAECEADSFDGPPLIEFHDLTGELVIIRRDLIAIVTPDPPSGSRVIAMAAGGYAAAYSVTESPEVVLALIRSNGRVLVVTDTEANDG